MLGPSRPMPRLGGRGRILHFGGAPEMCEVVEVLDGGRRVRVRAESGDEVEFSLNPASARFVASGPSGGPRLELLDGGAPAA